MFISRYAKQFRPTQPLAKQATPEEDSKRRTAFSFALANMIQMSTAEDTQLLLQTRDVVKRLEAQRAILLQAAELVSDQLTQMGSLSVDQKERIRRASLGVDGGNESKDSNSIVESSDISVGLGGAFSGGIPVGPDSSMLSDSYTYEGDDDILPQDSNVSDSEEEKDEWDINNVM